LPAPTGVARATLDGAAGWRVGSHPLGASGSRSRDPCTSSSSPADGQRRRRALESVWMHGLLAARVAVGLKRRRGRSGRRDYLYPFGSGRHGPRGRRPLAPRASRSAALRPGAQHMRGGWRHEYLQCDLCNVRAAGLDGTRTQRRTDTAARLCWRAVTRTGADTSPEPRPAGMRRPGPAPAPHLGPCLDLCLGDPAAGRRTRTRCRAARRPHLLVTSARTRTAGAPAAARPSAAL